MPCKTPYRISIHSNFLGPLGPEKTKDGEIAFWTPMGEMRFQWSRLLQLSSVMCPFIAHQNCTKLMLMRLNLTGMIYIESKRSTKSCMFASSSNMDANYMIFGWDDIRFEGLHKVW